MKRLLSNSFFVDTLKIATGTAGGRVILLAALLFATRIYDPEDFALLAVYMALVSTISVAANLRLDVAIPFADNDVEAGHLLQMALMIAAVVSGGLVLGAVIAPDALAALIGTAAIAPYLWLVGLGVFFLSSYSALQFWATRQRRFGSISRTRIGQAGLGAGTILGLGVAGFMPLGLLLGNMLSVGAGGVSLGIETLRKDAAYLRNTSRAQLAATLRKNRRYPLFSAPEALANVAGLQVPILIIAALSAEDAGQLYLAMQVMAAPMMLLGSSIAQVYASRAPEALRDGQLAALTLGIVKKLLLIGAAPLMILGLVAPLAMPLIFGAEWVRAGQLMSWMVPWMVLQLLASPISMVMLPTDRQRQMFALTLFGGALRIGAVSLPFALNSAYLGETFAAASALFYAVCLVVFGHAAGIWAKRAAKRIMLILPLCLLGYAAVVVAIWG